MCNKALNSIHSQLECWESIEQLYCPGMDLYNSMSKMKSTQVDL